jgi:hypothetical protein
MFPERVHYQRTDTPGWHIQDWETANKLLTYLDPERRPFAIFTLPDNSYVQCLGSKRRLTVEAREYRPDGSFKHWVFGRGRPTSEPVQIEVSTGSASIDLTQQLTMRDARVIMRQFLETRTFPETYHREDITERFVSRQDG